jgi:hypothetical protein
MDTAYDAHMPVEYKDWVGNSLKWVSLDWPSVFFPAGCSPLTTTSGFRFWLLMKGTAPLTVILLVVLRAIAVRGLRSGWNQSTLFMGSLEGMPFALFVAFCACPSISMSIVYTAGDEPVHTVLALQSV